MGSQLLRGEQRDSQSPEAQAKELFEQDAKRLGIEISDYYKRFGILGPAGRRRVRRHEVPMKEDK